MSKLSQEIGTDRSVAQSLHLFDGGFVELCTASWKCGLQRGIDGLSQNGLEKSFVLLGALFANGILLRNVLLFSLIEKIL